MYLDPFNFVKKEVVAPHVQSSTSEPPQFRNLRYPPKIFNVHQNDCPLPCFQCELRFFDVLFKNIYIIVDLDSVEWHFTTCTILSSNPQTVSKLETF